MLISICGIQRRFHFVRFKVLKAGQELDFLFLLFHAFPTAISGSPCWSFKLQAIKCGWSFLRILPTTIPQDMEFLGAFFWCKDEIWIDLERFWGVGAPAHYPVGQALFQFGCWEFFPEPMATSTLGQSLSVVSCWKPQERLVLFGWFGLQCELVAGAFFPRFIIDPSTEPSNFGVVDTISIDSCHNLNVMISWLVSFPW